MLSRKNEEAKNPIILLQNRFQFFVFLQFSLRGNCIRFIFCSHMFFIPQDVYNLFALVYTFFWINFLTLLFPSEIPASQPGQFSLNGHIFWHWAAATLKGLGEFQIKNSRSLFTIILSQKCKFQDSRFQSTHRMSPSWWVIY